MIKGIALQSSCTEDHPFLLELFASSRERELAHVKWSDEQRSNFLEMQFKAQQSHYASHFPGREQQIILVNGKPVGMQDVIAKNDEIRLLDIILQPKSRNAGLGSQLIGNILAEADGSSRPIRLHVEKFNPALHLYERMGFTIIEDTGVHYHMERLPK